MQKKKASGIMLTLMLIGVTLIFNIRPAMASGTIYIRADGSIDPPSAPISSLDNITYTFTSNIYDPIVVEKDGITIDGADYNLESPIVHPTLWKGIALENIGNETIRNVKIYKFTPGIYIVFSSNNTISGNKIANGKTGIHLSSSSNNIITGNNVTANEEGIKLKFNCNNNTISGNNITENRGGWGGIYLEGDSFMGYSDNNTITGNNIKANGIYGIYLFLSSNNTISKNNVVENQMVNIALSAGSNNTISSNNITAVEVWYGLTVKTSYNTVSGNTIANNEYGIVVQGSNNTFSRNNITNNGQGIRLDGWGDNNIHSNDFLNNTAQVVSTDSKNNRIYHNNFLNSTVHVASLGSTDIWDDGYPSGGNYWSDYVEKYPDAQELDDSGIWDTPYVIDANNTDRYPLMNPWTPTPPTIMANLDINPDTLNLKSTGKWITAYIQLPEGYNAADINASTILLNDTIAPVLDPKYGFVTNSSEYLVDHNGDGILERIVKLDRASVESLLSSQGFPLGEVALKITGELLDGTPFEGTDIIFVFFGGSGGRRK